MSLKVEIYKQFGSFTLDTAFEAEDGVTCLLGSSGCGKSMTLKCIAGIEKPDRGHIELDGVVLFDSEKRINLPPQKRQVGYLFQNYALFPNMTVRQNIYCGMHGIKGKEVRERKFQEMLDLLRIRGLENHRPSQLSGGQAQRVALARILVSEPRIIMLDEPFSALDTHLRGKLTIELRDLLKDFGHEVLMVSHNREEAYQMSRCIAVMDKGKIVTINETKQLFADPGTVAAAMLTGCKNIADAKKTGEYEVFVPDWNCTLKTAKPVRDDLRAVATRAHYYNTRCAQNSFPIVYVDEMEQPFEIIYEFRYANQSTDTEPLWWRLSKDKKPGTFPTQLGIAPENILLLY